MIQRSIASVVLAALCWLSMPVAFGPLQTSAVHSLQRDASSAHDHSCCPGSHPSISSTSFLAITPSAMPCGAELRAAPSRYRRIRQRCPSRINWSDPLRNEPLRSSPIGLLPVAVAASRHRQSVFFRLPSNEVRSCASEFSLLRLMRSTSRPLLRLTWLRSRTEARQ